MKQLIDIAQKAGQLILDIYNKSSLKIIEKEDKSPLTEADMASHDFIYHSLSHLYPTIPILSEESAEEYAYETRKHWNDFFLVDPLDGTKEFIKRNGEFTINIALIKKDKPILGIIHAPFFGLTYYAAENKGAYKIKNEELMPLSAKTQLDNKIVVVTSRSHACSKTQSYLDSLVSRGLEIDTVTIGSALKFGLIAEGKADIYPRISPTMEWDTAAGHIIVKEVGKEMTIIDTNEELQYNKISLVNPGFIVQNKAH